MKEQDQEARIRESKQKKHFSTKKLIRILSVTKSGRNADLILTQRRIVDKVITAQKRKGRFVSLPSDSETNMSCFGTCSIRCNRFGSNCRNCIKEFYEVK